VVEDVVDLVGLEIQIAWDTGSLSYVNHTVTMPVEYYPVPIPPSPYAGILHTPEYFLYDTVDSMAGTYRVVCVTLYPSGASFSGNGTAFVVRFQALAPTSSTLIRFTFTQMADTIPNPIPHTTSEYIVGIEDVLPPDFVSVEWTGTSPSPYMLSEFVRVNEAVEVVARIADYGGIAEVILSYRVQAGAWWNTTMAYNMTRDLWIAVILGHRGNLTVEFFITATDDNGNNGTSVTFTYDVKALLVGDTDGDCDVDIFDIVRVAGNYGEGW
jgi:hypothetical protein